MEDNTYVHGSSELRAHARAAVTLSEAKLFLARTISAQETETGASLADVEAAEVAVAAAKAAEYAARIAYTNPFGVEKTV